MFYAHYVLSKKGPLAKVWLAAHWDKKLTKAHVFETDVEKTVDNIISPKVKMALRTSGHLLLGVVRIYSRKQKYLIQDLGEACAKIKMAFRPGMVDLPVEGAVANTDTITLPEIFHDLESAVADLNDIDEQMVMHRSRMEEITLKDDFLTSKGGRFRLEDDLWGDNDFGGLLEDIEVARTSAGGLEQSLVSDVSQPNLSTGGLEPMEVDGGQQNTLRERKRPRTALEDPEFGFGDFGQGGLQEDILGDIPGLDDINLDPPSVPPLPDNNMDVDPPDQQPQPTDTNTNNMEEERDTPHQQQQQQDTNTNGEDAAPAPLVPANNTIREDSGFVLEPLDVPHRMRQRRKRKLVVDPIKELSGDIIKDQLLDASDIVQQKIVPSSDKNSMQWKEHGSTEYLLYNPSIGGMSGDLVMLVRSSFNNNMINDDIVADTTLPDIEDPCLVGGGLNDEPLPSVAPPPEERELEEVPPPNEEIDELPPHDLLDTIENDLGADEDPIEDPLIPDMPDLEEEEDTETVTQSTAEQQQDEKVEEFEQRRWNKRSQHVLNMLEKGFKNSDTIQFSSLTKRCSRKVAASRFYSCLLLGKEGAIKFSQSKPFAPINITKGPLHTTAD